MSLQNNWKYKDLKKHPCSPVSCNNCDYCFQSGNKAICLIDNLSVNKYFNCCDCFCQDKFNVGDKVKVNYKGKLVETVITDIIIEYGITKYCTSISDNNYYKIKYEAKEIQHL